MYSCFYTLLHSKHTPPGLGVIPSVVVHSTDVHYQNYSIEFPGL